MKILKINAKETKNNGKEKKTQKLIKEIQTYNIRLDIMKCNRSMQIQISKLFFFKKKNI